MRSRKDRDRLIHLIQQYLDEKIDSFEFDDLLQVIKDNTEDGTVLYVIDQLWYLYDDIKDHKILFTKKQWDFVQRVLLILNSDKKIVVREKKKFTLRQLLSIISIIAFVMSYLYFGFTLNLLLVSMGLGVISIAISKWRKNEEEIDVQNIKEELYPFSSLTELLSLRRNQKNFKKSYYNKALERREIRNKFTNSIMLMHFWLGWLVWSPLVLIYQSLPEITIIVSVE